MQVSRWEQLCGLFTSMDQGIPAIGTRVALVRDDPACADITKPYLRGQDIGRWAPDWQGLWMIVLASSGNRA